VVALGARHVYGHIVEEGRNLIVSGGLMQRSSVRFGSPPEIVMIELSA
jgi:predicted MPP superfamily phosphohydrolase